MGRPATGSARWSRSEGVWEARISVPGVGRKHAPLPGVPACLVSPSKPRSKCPCASCAQARRVAKIVSDRTRDEGRVPEYTGEVANEWYERYHAYQVELGQTDAGKKRSRWRKWIAPRIGTKAMAAVTSDDIEDIRDALDAGIEAWKRAGGKGGKRGAALSGKTAMNVWSCVTSSFKAATSSKRRDLRVLDGRPNPCLDVIAPGDRESRQSRRKTFLYPREASALLASADVPIEWREVYAIALYTYLRPGELRVLTWADIDLDAGVVHVTKAWDYEDEKVKPPKTRNGVRRVAIEASLRPLLEALRARAIKQAGQLEHLQHLVAPALAAFGEDHLAQQFREHLTRSKVTRAELHVSTRTHVQSNFRSFRDSGITYLAILGLSVDKIMRRAGHDMVQTTMGYVKQAEDLTGDLGVPFGPLPRALLGSGGSGLDSGYALNDSAAMGCRRRESNPQNERPETSSEDARSAEDHGSSSSPSVVDDRTVLAEKRPAESKPKEPDDASSAAAADRDELVRLSALSRLVESLSAGDVRVLASEVRHGLERLCGPVATVHALDSARGRRK